MNKPEAHCVCSTSFSNFLKLLFILPMLGLPGSGLSLVVVVVGGGILHCKLDPFEL